MAQKSLYGLRSVRTRRVAGDDSTSCRGSLGESYEGRHELDELDEQLGEPDEYCHKLDELDEQLGKPDEDYLELDELKEQLGESSKIPPTVGCL